MVTGVSSELVYGRILGAFCISFGTGSFGAGLGATLGRKPSEICRQIRTLTYLLRALINLPAITPSFSI